MKNINWPVAIILAFLFYIFFKIGFNLGKNMGIKQYEEKIRIDFCQELYGESIMDLVPMDCLKVLGVGDLMPEVIND